MPSLEPDTKDKKENKQDTSSRVECFPLPVWPKSGPCPHEIQVLVVKTDKETRSTVTKVCVKQGGGEATNLQLKRRPDGIIYHKLESQDLTLHTVL